MLRKERMNMFNASEKSIDCLFYDLRESVIDMNTNVDDMIGFVNLYESGDLAGAHI